jgi:sphinganine-1-phosphate aldolase
VSRLKAGEPAPDGSAAMYGMVGQMADMNDANAFLLDFLDGIFSRA